MLLILAFLAPFVAIIVLLQLHRHFQWRWLESLLSRYDRLFRDKRRRFPVIELAAVAVIVLILVLVFRRGGSGKTEFDNRIAVLADSTEWKAMEGLLSASFERIVHTPQPEKTFRLHHFTGPGEPEKSRYRYCLMLADLSSRGDVSAFILSTLLDGREKEELRHSGRLFTLKINEDLNRWIAVLAAADTSALKGLISVHGDSLYALIDQDSRQQLKKSIFAYKGEAVIARDLLRKYGWALEKQSNLILADNDPEGRFVSFGSWMGKRWMFVYWEEGRALPDLTEAWMVRVRDSLGAASYEGVKVEPYYLDITKTLFKGRPALMTRGLWADEDPVMGGPFTNYSFFDSTQKRLYMIDMFVHAPESFKLPYLRPMEVIAGTFVTAADSAAR